MPDDASLSAEDAKLVTLARTSRARTSSVEGAAVRDQDGRTYVATGVDLPSLKLSALQTAVAMAVSSGATGIEAAAVVADPSPPGAAVADPVLGGTGTALQPDLTVVREFAGADVVVHLADSAGRPLATVRT